MAKRYRVTLKVPERIELQQLISRGKGAARKLGPARVLLQADESAEGPACTDEQIASSLNLSTRTIERTRERFVEQGLEAALVPPCDRVYRRKLDGRQEAKLIAPACSKPPAGKRRWTLRLLADQAVELQIADSLSHKTVRQTRKKRAQTALEKDVVHPAQAVGRVRLSHGRCVGGVPPAVRSEAAGGVSG